MAAIADLINERSRRLLAEQLAKLAEDAAQEAAKPPPTVFRAPPEPDHPDDAEAAE